MKKPYTLSIASVLVASCLCLSACSAGNTETSKSDDDSGQQTDKQAETTQQATQTDTLTGDWQLKKVPYTSEAASKITAADTKREAEKATQETFFGNWFVKRDLKTPSVSAYGQREINKVLNRKIVYSAAVAKFNDVSIQNPKYIKNEMTEESFSRDTRLKFKDLGIKGETIVVVNVQTNQNEYWSESPAGHFIVKDKDTLILADQGQYFELVRDN